VRGAHTPPFRFVIRSITKLTLTLPCVFVVMFGMKATRDNVFKVEWGLPEIAPEYRKQLAEIVNAFWAVKSNIDEYQHQAHTVFRNASLCGHIKLPQEAVIRGSIPTIARITGIEQKYIKYAMSNNGQPIFYNFRPGYIVSLGDDAYITDFIEDFSRPYLKFYLPETVRIQKVIPTTSDNLLP